MQLHPNELKAPSMQFQSGVELITANERFRLIDEGSHLGAVIIREQPEMTEFTWTRSTSPSSNTITDAECAGASYGFEFCEQDCHDHYSGGNKSISIPCAPTENVTVETVVYGAGKATPSKPMQEFTTAPTDEGHNLVLCLKGAIEKAIEDVDKK